MADVSVKMGVSGIQQFKQGMNEAQASVKTLDAALKANEKALKKSGDAENYLQTQTNLLNQKLKQQQNIVKNAEQALKQMEQNGVKQSSTAYQNMQRKLIEAQSAMMDTEMALNELGTAATGAAQKTDQLQTSLGGLNKKISLDQVIGGIGSITSAMENAGKKAVELGKKIWENITDASRWGDDTATQAMILNMDVEDYQRYKKVFDTVGEITVQEWQKAKLKVQKAINDPTGEQTDILALLGIDTHEILQGKEGPVQGAAKGFEEIFWQIGETLREKVASGEMTQDLADTYANALFGKGFAELNPMFVLGQEGFTKALEEQNVVTEESVNKLASLNDQLIKLEGDFDTLKQETLAELAPALEDAAKALDGMLSSLLEYLKTPEGQKALEDMGNAVSGLFSDISNVDPQEVVKGFSDVFNTIVDGLKWLDENKGTVIAALEAIVGGWAALNITGGILDIVKIVQGIQGVTGAGTAAAAGQAAGAAWGGSFAKAVLAAAPWLIGLYTLLNPAGTDGGGVSEGGPTQAAIDFWNNDPAQWEERQLNVAKRYGDFAGIMSNQAALNIMLDPSISDEEMFSKLEEEIGLVPIETEPEVPDNAAEALAEQIGTVHVDVVGDIIQISDRRSRMGTLPRHANGIWSVPFDGYMSVLDKGEQVVPAREVSSRSYSSNLYVESMIMNNGQDAEGLAAAMAAANQRTMRGYGS